MRKKTTIFLALILLGSNFALAASLRFQAPTPENPSYRISFPFEVKEPKVTIQNVLLNNQKIGTVLFFKGGKNIPSSTTLEKGIYEVVLDYAWASGKPYTATILWQVEKAKSPKKLEVKGISPEKGGIPGGREGFYRLYEVEEPAGIERKAEICTLVVTAPRPEIEAGDFVIFDGEREIPYQVLEKKESLPPEVSAATHPATLSYKLAFPVDAQPKEKKWLLLLKGEKSAQPERTFQFTGEGLGKSVKTKWLQLSFHPQSGQINTIDYPQEGVQLFNKAGVIHWNPDVFIPGIAWDHSFDWNPPAVFEEKTGDILYINSRRGPLPRIPDALLEVKYVVEIDAPYFISETLLTFQNGLGVIAVRNDEMVLYKELFDSFIYKPKNGAIVQGPLNEKEGFPFGLVHIAPEDADWVGLINTKDNFGFFSLRLEAMNKNLDAAGEFLHRPGTYFYAPSEGNYVYWVRPLIYTWADYTTNNLFTYVPRGSFFYEKNAYILLRISPELSEKINALLAKLRHPLRVF